MNTTTRPQIAINVMRSRLTVVGFNIAIVSFQISTLINMQGGVFLTGFEHAIHFRSDIALLVALASSMLALVAFISATSINNKSVCDHWSFIAGDLLMYLGLACTVTGFFSPLNDTFLYAIEKDPQLTPLIIFQVGIKSIGAIVWIATIYIGPAITLFRSPFSQTTNRVLAIAYCMTLLLLFLFYQQALILENLVLDKMPSEIDPYFYEFFQFLVW
ncbi:hypothetical protein CW745_09600 [Psychromonas sp. psych-6C06]|nr:hypothetical protein CW745_09600 [Psychromonas sp. psych-6C06]